MIIPAIFSLEMSVVYHQVFGVTHLRCLSLSPAERNVLTDVSRLVEPEILYHTVACIWL